MGKLRSTLIWFSAGAAIAIAIGAAIAAGGGDSGSSAALRDGVDPGSDAAAEQRAEHPAADRSRRERRRRSREEPPALVELIGGSPAAGVRRLTFERGERVRIRIASNEAATVRVEGLGASTAIPAAGTATLELDARRAGVFALVLGGSGATIAELVIEPRAPAPDRVMPQAPADDEQGR